MEGDERFGWAQWGTPHRSRLLGRTDGVPGRAVNFPDSNLHSSADFLNDQPRDLGQMSLF